MADLTEDLLLVLLDEGINGKVVALLGPFVLEVANMELRSDAGVSLGEGPLDYNFEH